MFVPAGRFIVVLSIAIFGLASSAKNNSTQCDRLCGTETVPYPFGFSDGCIIRLGCLHNSSMQIEDFTVSNVTSDQILVSVPTKCERKIEDLKPLFGANFKPTTNNSLVLDGCSEKINCTIPRNVLWSTIGLDKCESMNHSRNISCYSGDSDYLDFDEMKNRSKCSGLISSVMFDSATAKVSAALDMQMMELRWWVNETYAKCDRNANRLTFGHEMHLCKCKEGYTGDGYDGGDGCQEEHSHPSGPSAPPPPSRKHPSKLQFLITGIAAGASLLAALVIICYCIKRRSTTLKSRLSAKRLISEAAGTVSVPFYPSKEIERATNGFSEKQRLGTGAYGTVYKGKLHNEQWVAIKKIRYRDHESVEQVMNEIKLLSSVSHPNLVRLLGCCIENGEQILVYEFMPNGTLSQHLQREWGSALPWTIRLTIAAETAHAIAHLHSAINPPIYHRDIKSSNILLDYDFRSKVADFGLSRFGMVDDSHVSTAPQGTPGYVDPQYHQNFHLSDKSDVYSFGVVLVEIITALKVVDFSRPHSEINLAALATDRIGKGRIDEILDPFLEPNRDAWTLSSINKVAELAFRCLAFHRDMRPSMMEVADELEQIRLSGWAPMEDTIHMGSSVASTCSSPYQGSEKSFNVSMSKRTTVGSRRLIVPQKINAADLPITKEMKDSSPVSVQDPWPSEQSSPSTNSLLGNIAR